MTNELTNPHADSGPEQVDRRTVVSMLLTPIMVGIVIAGAFVGLYVGLQCNPTPHHLPIAVEGTHAAHTAALVLGDKAHIIEVPDADAALRSVHTHTAVAALVSHGSTSELLIAGASGRSATGAATALTTAVARQIGSPLTTTTDVVPLVRHDPQGLSGFYLVFGTTLAAFILAQVMTSLGPIFSGRTRVVTILIGCVCAAVIAAILAGPVYGSVPAPLLFVAGVLSLLASAVGLTTLAISTAIGPLGNIISTLLFTTLGNSISGATISPFLLPPLFSAVGGALPPGAAFRAVTQFGYFDGHQSLTSILVLIGWIAGASLLLLSAHHIRSKTRT